MQSEINQQAIKHIVEAMNDDSLIIFVGAGVSANSGLPNWNQLIDKFREELLIDNSETDNIKVAQFYYDMWGKQKYLQKITTIFDEYSSAQPNEIHNHIYKIQPKHIITTNYDSLIEAKMNKGVVKYNVIKNDMDIPYSDASGYIIKMHGDLETKNFVLKENDYLDYENNFYMVSTLIKSLIMNNTILFIGYSLGDSTFNSIFRLIHNSFGENTRKAYFYTARKPKHPIIEYYKKKGIHVLSSGNEKVPNELIGKKTEEFLNTISKQKNPKATNEDEIWEELKFLDKLSFVESQDIARNANLTNKAFLFYPDRYLYQNEDEKISLEEDSDLNSLIRNKTWINNFLGNEITHPKKFESNRVLLSAYELYSCNKYSEAKGKFREIANEAYKRKDYYNFLIAEFNVFHIHGNYFERDIELEETVYDDIEFSEILDRVIDSSRKDMRKLVIYLRDNIFSFKFALSKIDKMDSLLDKLRSERLSYKKGGSSSNSNLSILKFEFRQFMSFLELNCICIYQYREFKSVVNRYFESLLVALDNSNYPENEESFFGGTSSIIQEIEIEDVEIVLPHIDIKMLPVYLDSYSLSEIKVTDEAFDFIIEKALNCCDKCDSHISIEFEQLNKYIYFLSLVKIKKISKLVTLFKMYPIFSSNRDKVRKLLNLIIKNSEKLTIQDMNVLTDSINEKIELIVSKNYEIHLSTFPLYAILLEKLRETNADIYVSTPTVNYNLEVIGKIDDKLNEIEQYEEYLSSLYKFLNVKESKVIDQILMKYSHLPENEINYSFLISMILADVNDFISMKNIIFRKLIGKINSSSDNSIKIFPDPTKTAISDLFNLALKEYFSFEEILETRIDDKLKGQFPEVDWFLFDKRDDGTIEKLMKNRSFSQIKKYFIKNEKDLNLLNEWALKQFQENNVNLIERNDL